MVFSYSVKNSELLKRISVTIQPGVLTLITGVENTSFGLIGGIISGLFPVEDKDIFPQLQELIKYFTGDLEIVEGALPESSVYLGPDPEKHLLFSRVDEEIEAQTTEAPDLILSRFGLEDHFLRRKISTLSGGEKMKLALAIAFSKPEDCIVLHGIVPWLDKNGKNSLIRELSEKLDKGKSAVVFEQEIADIKNIAGNISFFNGSKVIGYKQDHFTDKHLKIGDVTTMIGMELEKEKAAPKEILQFKSVRFGYMADQDGDSVLENVNFTLYGSRIYSLVGDNGTGKSTIARLILRIEKPGKGEIFFLGDQLSRMDRARMVKTICFVDQFPEQQIVLSCVADYKKRALKRNNYLAVRLLDSYFDKNRNFPITVLSPLQLKILSIASSVSVETRLVLIDEPTWGIDLDGELVILRILSEILKELNDIAVLIISHDMDFISRLNAEVLRIEGGSVTLTSTTAYGIQDLKTK